MLSVFSVVFTAALWKLFTYVRVPVSLSSYIFNHTNASALSQCSANISCFCAGTSLLKYLFDSHPDVSRMFNDNYLENEGMHAQS